MVKIALKEDKEQVMELAMQFAEASPYKDMIDRSAVEQVVDDVLESKYAVILLHTEGGFIAGRVAPFPFGVWLIGQELAWWVNPEKRGSGIGQQLREGFEFWAKKIGCKTVVFSTLEKELGEKLETEGYKPYEYAYMKEL